MIIEKTIKFEVYPHDLPELMTYNAATKAVEALGDGWLIPARDELLLLYEQKDVIGGFVTKKPDSGSDFPYWYWSSTENPYYRDYVYIVRFSDGHDYWDYKDNYRLSCRPVRLVAPAAPSPVGQEA